MFSTRCLQTCLHVIGKTQICHKHLYHTLFSNNERHCTFILISLLHRCYCLVVQLIPVNTPSGKSMNYNTCWQFYLHKTVCVLRNRFSSAELIWGNQVKYLGLQLDCNRTWCTHAKTQRQRALPHFNRFWPSLSSSLKTLRLCTLECYYNHLCRSRLVLHSHIALKSYSTGGLI